MNPKRFWLELVIVCAITSLAMGLALATVGGTASLALNNRDQEQNLQAGDTQTKTIAVQGVSAQEFQAGDTQTFAGVVTDSICGAKHDKRMNQSAAGCTKLCVRKGASFSLVDGDKIYKLQGQDEYLDKFAEERVKVSGTLNGDTIQVNSVDGMNRLP